MDGQTIDKIEGLREYSKIFVSKDTFPTKHEIFSW